MIPRLSYCVHLQTEQILTSIWHKIIFGQNLSMQFTYSIILHFLTWENHLWHADIRFFKTCWWYFSNICSKTTEDHTYWVVHWVKSYFTANACLKRADFLCIKTINSKVRLHWRPDYNEQFLHLFTRCKRNPVHSVKL